jgi:hypothetical protein
VRIVLEEHAEAKREWEEDAAAKRKLPAPG